MRQGPHLHRRAVEEGSAGSGAFSFSAAEVGRLPGLPALLRQQSTHSTAHPSLAPGGGEVDHNRLARVARQRRVPLRLGVHHDDLRARGMEERWMHCSGL